MGQLVKMPEIDITDPYNAIKAAEKIVKEKSDNAGAHYYLGALYYKANDVQLARREFEKAIECDDGYSKAYSALTLCLLYMEKDKKAEEILRKRLKISPDDLTLLKALAYVYIINEDKRAISLLSRAIRLEKKQERRRELEDELEDVRDLLPIEPEPFEVVWAMARKDYCRSSSVDTDEAENILRFSLSEKWTHRFESTISQEIQSDVPSPIITENMIIVSEPSMNSFAAISIETGDQVWSSGILVDKLTYASTPVYASTSLIFAAGHSIKRLSIDSPTSTEDVLGDERVEIVSCCTPLVYEDSLVFGFKKHVLVYNLEWDETYFVPVDIEGEDELRSPVVYNEQVVFLSKEGKIFTLFLDGLANELSETAEAPVEGICSAPCVAGDNIYFEIVDSQGSRKVCVYNPQDGGQIVKEIEEEICSPEHAHLNFSPVVYRGGILLSSDVNPIVYRIRLVGDILEIVPLEIDVQVGPTKVVNVSHIFSTVVGTYFISKTTKGFFYINLEYPKDNDITVFPCEVIAQPVVWQDRIFFLCEDRLRCYIIQQEET